MDTIQSWFNNIYFTDFDSLKKHILVKIIDKGNTYDTFIEKVDKKKFTEYFKKQLYYKLVTCMIVEKNGISYDDIVETDYCNSDVINDFTYVCYRIFINNDI